MSYFEEFNFERLARLGHLSIEEFLNNYWQKKPVLIRQAFPNFESLISADELAGLALEEDVVSRLVREDKERKNWSVTHGPIPESLFSTLPANYWSLLVQHVDSLDPRINGLLNAFRFIPNWRLDDIMVSYASDAGGVGPHFDYFDVFLLQAEGRRRWRLGQTCDANTPLLPDQPMKILSDFTCTDDWIVEPGDLLYIPARISHWGEAIGECMTYSIGFRAPSHSDILLEYSQDAAASSGEDRRYQDPVLDSQLSPGEISQQSVQEFRKILQSYWNDEEKLACWLGEYATEPKQPVDEELVNPMTCLELKQNIPCQLNPFSRAAFYSLEGLSICFIDGRHWPCSHALAEALSNYRSLCYGEQNQEDKIVLEELTELSLLIESSGG